MAYGGMGSMFGGRRQPPGMMGRQPPGGMPGMGGGYGGMGLGGMFQSGGIADFIPWMGGVPGIAAGGGQSVPPNVGAQYPTIQQRPVGALDWAQMGAGALTDIGNWWETRQERLLREEQEEDRRADRDRRRREMGEAWRAANR